MGRNYIEGTETNDPGAPEVYRKATLSRAGNKNAIDVRMTESETLYEIIDYASTLITYIGRTPTHNAKEEDASWKIGRLSQQGDNEVTEWVANSDNEVAFDQIWDDRSALFPYRNQYSLNFGGTDESLSIPNVTTNNFSDTSVFSLSLWLKTSSMDSIGLFHKSNSGSGANNAIRLHIAGNQQLTFAIRATSTTDRLRVEIATPTINNNTWRNIVVTYTGSKLASGVRIYVDGVNQTLTVLNDALVGSITGAENWRCAADGNATGDFLTGRLDEICFWNTVLTQAQVTELYNAGAAENLYFHTAFASLKHWYSCNYATDFPSVRDTTGSNTATMVNMEAADYDTDTP